MVFESHPTTSDDISKYRKDTLVIKDNKFYYRPYLKEGFDKLVEIIKHCKEMNFPRTQLHKIVSEITDLKENRLGVDDWKEYFKKRIENIELRGEASRAKDVKDFLIGDDFKDVRIIDFYEIYDYVHN